MKKVIITGAAGFIPSHLAEGLLIRGYQVLGIDNFLTGNEANLSNCNGHENYTFCKANVNVMAEIDKIILDFKPDFIFHYAACVGVKRTLDNPMWVLQDIKGIENVLELARKVKTERVFYSSSSEVYGEPVEFPQNEDTTPLNSKLPYAVVKNLGEVYLKAFQKEYDMNYNIFRFFNTYGPRQSSDFVISKFINNAIANKPLTIYGAGDQTRTFCFVNDNITATINCMESEIYANRTVNIGSNSELKIIDLAKIVIKLTNSKSEIIHLPPLEEGDMTRRLPNIDNMKKLLGNDLIEFETGLTSTIEFFQAHG